MEGGCEISSSDEEYAFLVPQKRIGNPENIAFFLSSEAYCRLMNFIEKVNKAVRGKTISDAHLPSNLLSATFLQKLRGLIGVMKCWINHYPPISQPTRFGNKSFRKWVDHMNLETEPLLEDLLPDNCKKAVIELAPYFKDSFGNATRIDYGTGHELSFAAFLTCVEQLGIILKDDLPTYTYIGLVIFGDYLSLARQLQSVYMLEPAGSHGVWGLDDYQFLPFLWGSSQLIGHPKFDPSSVMSDSLIEAHADDFLYFGAIRFIKSLKKGPFHEHSPMLYDISGVASWEKVNQGLKKMFVVEILRKIPIMQHFVFGKLLPYRPSQSAIPPELRFT